MSNFPENGALELSRRYFEAAALPSLKKSFPELADVICAGLVGNGSECFGFDDELSRDHDWGVDFFVWLPESESAAIPDVAAWKTRLFAENPPEHARERSQYGGEVGVYTVPDYCRRLIGRGGVPDGLNEWINTPEENVAMLVNGDLFVDKTGEFTALREHLCEYIPEDLRLKRMSFCLMKIAQTGQYNFSRMLRRQDTVAARTCLSIFSDYVIYFAYLAARKFRPYYKWRYRAMPEIPCCDVKVRLKPLAEAPLSADGGLTDLIEDICAQLAQYLRAVGLSSSQSDFLTAQGEDVLARVQNERLRGLPSTYEI
ncbi:MAG: DUF4037 domain-containing protein [Oscillospiraceae bacterium]|jgi:hypothetical protein|nr:DUF4037 domain-containing protein [Oscillospiraceae bacterium]